jgi:hypothetical protein
MAKKTQLSSAKRFAQIENISMLGMTERMGPVALHVYAESYLSAALALPNPPVPFDPVLPYLICHAIELALKAFLSLNGGLMVDLAGGAYGHNLDSLLAKALEADLAKIVNLTEPHRDAIRRGTNYYAGKVFEYPAVGEALSAYPHMPPLDVLRDAASLLVEALRQPCREAK